MKNKAFTLIELLVVVLIIGILAAIAVPQYQKAVMKSRATEAILNLRAIYEAQKRYELATGSRTTDLSKLDIKIKDGFYAYNCASCDGSCCYAIPQDSSNSYPQFEGVPIGTMYCRGTKEQCEAFSNQNWGGREDYWIMKVGTY